MDPSRFLSAMGQALATMSLYIDSHPARARAIDSSFERLQELQRDGRVVFSFIDSEVLFNREPLRDLKGWEWGVRLSELGIQRVEFAPDVPRAEWEDFLLCVYGRAGLGIGGKVEREANHPSIRYGALGVMGKTGISEGHQIANVEIKISLQEEAEAVRWLQQEIADGNELSADEAEAVVCSLSVAMHSDSEIVMPLLQLKEFDEYTASHSINVSVLAMALAEFMGLGARDVRAIGVAGLLHDVGMIRVPKEIVAKEGPPTPQEWRVIKQHPVDGAKLILRSEPNMDLAAVVAYEHHMLPNGAGYPHPHYERDIHYGTKVVQVCAVYDALRTRRYHRDAMPPENAMQHVAERAGSEFDLETGRAFVKMIRQWERRMFMTDDTSAVRLTPSHGVPVIAG